MSTDYRFHGLYVTPDGHIEVGITTAKSDRIRIVPLDRNDAWKLAQGLLAALADTEGRP